MFSQDEISSLSQLNRAKSPSLPSNEPIPSKHNDRFITEQILANQKSKRPQFEMQHHHQPEESNFSEVEMNSDSDYIQPHLPSPNIIFNGETSQVTKMKVGFSNHVWRKAAFNIITYIARFITYLLTTTETFKFSFVNRQTFQFINDRSSEYDYYLTNGYIRQKTKPSLYVFMLSSSQSSQKRIRQRLLAIHFLKSIQMYLQSILKKIKVIHPNSLLKICWDIIVLTILLFNINYIPLKVSFQLNDQSSYLITFLFDQLPTYIFILEILLNFFTAFYSHGYIPYLLPTLFRVLITNRVEIAKHYLKNNFLLDFVVIIPFIVSKFNISYIEFILLIRINRVVYIFNNLEEILNLRENFATFLDVSKLIVFFIFTSHILACAWHFLAVVEKDLGVQNTWIAIRQLDDVNWLTRYITSFYWSSITTLTIGYGDIVPVMKQTDAEMIFVIFVALISSVVFGYTITSIGSIFSQITETNKKKRDKMTLIQKYLKKRGLSKELQIRVRKFYEHFLKIDQEKEKECQEMLNSLAINLQSEVKVDLYKKLLKKSKFFRQRFSEEFLNQLSIYVKEKNYIPEQNIFEEGQMMNELHFMIKGETATLIRLKNDKKQVSLSRDSEERTQNIIQRQRKGETLGEQYFITQSALPYTIKAMKFTRVAYISFEDFARVLDENKPEKEKYLQQRNILEMKENSYKFYGCPFCKQNHDFRRCPFTFYLPNLRKVIKRQYQFKQDRQRQERPIRTEYKTMKDLAKILEDVLLIMIEKQFITEDQLDQQFLIQRGFQLASAMKEESKNNYFQQDSYLSQQSYVSKKDKAVIRQNIRKYSKGFLHSNETVQLDMKDPIYGSKKDISSKHNTLEASGLVLSRMSFLDVLEKEYLHFIREEAIQLDQYHNFQDYYPGSNLDKILPIVRQKQLKSTHKNASKLKKLMFPSLRSNSRQQIDRLDLRRQKSNQYRLSVLQST